MHLLIKLCKKCNTEKSISSFWKDKNRKQGYYPSCKECESKRNRRGSKYNHNDIVLLSDHYVKNKLHAKGFKYSQITPDLIEIQRQLINLKRSMHENV